MPLIGTTRVITDMLGIPFMLQAAILFGLYSILFVIVSLLTPAPEPAHISDVCWNSPRDVFTDGQERGLQSPQVLGALIFFAVILLYAFMG